MISFLVLQFSYLYLLPCSPPSGKSHRVLSVIGSCKGDSAQCARLRGLTSGVGKGSAMTGYDIIYQS